MKDNIRQHAASVSHYKYKIYLSLNPYLEPSNFLNDCRFIASKIIKFRVGSHYLPIETGRWCRIPRNDRLCQHCKVLGDEIHLLYNCSDIDRTGLQLPVQLPICGSVMTYLSCLIELIGVANIYKS